MLHRILGDVMYRNELIVAYYCLTLPILFSKKKKKKTLFLNSNI
jgi:hypothetical protein